MFATLTSKGQLTLPKEIRDRLSLDAGAILNFQIQADNTITARRVLPDARRISGLLKSPHATSLTSCCACGSTMTRRRTSASTLCWPRRAACQVRCW